MTTNGSDPPLSNVAQDCFPDDECLGYERALAPPDAADDMGRGMLERLGQIIEGDLIPRLMLALDSPGSQRKDQAIAEHLGENVDEFVQILIAHDASVASQYVTTLRSQGLPLSVLYLDLLAPAARRLGVMWEEDECSFTDVTIGVCRMHQVLLEFGRCFDAAEGSDDSGNNALVLPVPGEQHTFGIVMVMEFMRRGGWHCYTGAPASSREFHRLVRSQDFDVIGLSVSADRHVDSAKKLVSEIRHGARNADAVIMGGGRVFVDQPELAEEIGMDVIASDGREAVAELRRLRPHSKHSPAN